MISESERPDIYRRLTWLFAFLIAAGCIAGITVPAGLGWDFANFYDAGRRVAAGQIADLYSPLSLINGQPPQGSTGFFGAPISAFLYVPLAPFAAGTALVLFKMQNVAAFTITFIALWKFYRSFAAGGELTASQFTALFVFLCLIYQPFWTVFRVGGQTTPTVLLFLSLGLIAHTAGRLWLSALCVVVAALIKPSLGPAVVLLACISGIDFFGRLAVLGTATGLLSLALMGWPIHAVFLDNMLERSQVRYSWFYNSSLDVLPITLREYAGAAVTGTVDLALRLLTYAIRAAAVVTVLWLAWQAHAARWAAHAKRHFAFSLALVFYLIGSPTIFEHYLSVLFPFLIYVVANHHHFSRRARVIVALIFVASIGQNLILVNWLRHSIEVDSLSKVLAVVFYKTAPLVLTMLFLWMHGREWLESHASRDWERHAEAPGRPAA